MKNLPVLISFYLSILSLWSANPVPYSGKVSIGGVNYHGDANFTFALQDRNGTTPWRNGASKDESIKVNIRNGRYTVLLGGQGMNPLPPQLFLDYDELYLKVLFDNGDGSGLRHLTPDQRITATPRALVAEVAKIAKNADSAKVADSVQAGAITKSMLGNDVLTDLNRTVTSSEIAANTITTAQLNEQILKYLKPEITLAPQAPGLIFNGQTITLHSRAEGKYLNYQWYKNGQAIAGADKKRFVIEDVNGTQHDGNYTLVVSNDFGSITTQPTALVVDGTPTSHTVASISMDMIFCPPGTFTMGSPSNETGRGGDETQHQVTLSHGFYLGKYEVTQAQYQTVMNGNSAGLSADPSQFKGSNRPVEKASWEDAQIFLSQLNSIEQTAGRLPKGWKYVLPTEAQWEYACRAGTTTAYSWGNDINSSRANYNWDGGANDGNDFKQTRDVGLYAANPWGFFDMQGNVWEWVSDWKANYLTGAQTDPEGPASGSHRVSRGGSWNNDGTYLRSAKRNHHTPSNRSFGIGFRVGFQPVQPDEVNPELELFGGAAITREAGQAWAEPGVAGHDARDGNVTASVTVTGMVDMNTTGTYLLTYSVTDAAGNTATANRTVTVVGNRTVDLNATVAMDMIWCPPGTFTMGSPTTEAGRQADREDEHNVSLTKGFYLGKYEVTQAQYEAVMTGNTDSLSATPSQWPNNPNRPVEKVSWADAQIFLTRLNAQHSANIPAGWAYVLPTESQWEYACRAGTTTAYSWGITIASSNANYNWDGGANDGNDFKQTRDVGQYAVNPWGFFDMHGNVWEWTADWYQAAYPTGNPVVDPTGPASGSLRVKRGGSWNLDGAYLRSAKRNYNAPSDRYNNFGFRVGFQQQ
jgi:formylglycine-generating enzyme required for sulfatase activity